MMSHVLSMSEKIPTSFLPMFILMFVYKSNLCALYEPPMPVRTCVSRKETACLSVWKV